MKTATIAIAISALAVGGFGWFDTVSYRSALQAYQMVAKERRPQHQAQWQRDEARYKRCDPMRVANKARSTIDFTPEGRHCLIDALAQTASVQGALVLLRNASVALSKDPDDKALRRGRPPWLLSTRHASFRPATGRSMSARSRLTKPRRAPWSGGCWRNLIRSR